MAYLHINALQLFLQNATGDDLMLRELEDPTALMNRYIGSFYDLDYFVEQYIYRIIGDNEDFMYLYEMDLIKTDKVYATLLRTGRIIALVDEEENTHIWLTK